MNTPAGGMKRRRRVLHVCKTCGVTFERRPCERGRFCSKSCWIRRSPSIPTTCPVCKKVFTVHRALGQRFCSRSCARRGTRSNAWKDGKSMERQRARLSPQLKVWRNAVYRRDGWSCVRCGAKGKIHAHHINPWAKFPHLRFDPENGETLCENCHGKEHGIDFSKRKNRNCPDCGKVTKGRGKACRSCSIRNWHAHRPGPQLLLF